jgi:hypothetical protein
MIVLFTINEIEKYIEIKELLVFYYANMYFHLEFVIV